MGGKKEVLFGLVQLVANAKRKKGGEPSSLVKRIASRKRGEKERNYFEGLRCGRNPPKEERGREVPRLGQEGLRKRSAPLRPSTTSKGKKGST